MELLFSLRFLLVISSIFLTFATPTPGTATENGHSTTPYSSGFRECLQKQPIKVTFPEDSTWLYESQPLKTQRLKKPLAVAYPFSTNDVVDLIKCSVSNGVKVNPRGGGHNYEQFSANDDQLVINLASMNDVFIDAKRKVARVGGGAKIGPIYYKTGQFNLSFSGGSCGTMGIGGHVQGGGYGYSTRTHGWGADNVLEVELVDYRGEVFTANAHENSDLFWAVRGGGGGTFGVVTSMLLNLFEGPRVTTFSFTYNISEDSRALEIARRVMDAKPWEASKDINSQLRLESSKVVLTGFYFGSDGDTGIRQWLSTLNLGNHDTEFVYTDTILNIRVAVGETNNDGVVQSTKIDFSEFNAPPWPFADPVYPVPAVSSKPPKVSLPEEDTILFRSPVLDAEMPVVLDSRIASKMGSAVYRRGLNDKELSALWAFVKGKEFGKRVVQVDFSGVPKSENKTSEINAFPHRHAPLMSQIMIMCGSEDYEAAAKELADLLDQLKDAVMGNYVNYPDLNVGTDPSVYMPAYFGDNVDRLVEIKTKYDPDNWFNNPQSVVPRATTSECMLSTPSKCNVASTDQPLTRGGKH